MLNVFITIDTETYPLRGDWRVERLEGDIERDIYGVTRDGSFGLLYQIAVLNSHSLKAVFFVESLFADAVGVEPLRQIVSAITSAGHEVQLHPHPEWLAWVKQPVIVPHGRETIREFSPHEQDAVIGRAIENLAAVGASDVSAFRAGDYAANAGTLLALKKLGLRFDSSFNACYPNSLNDVLALKGRHQPTQVGGLWEFPISYWRCIGTGLRHAQITSSSIGELKAALLAAWHNGWHSFVIVSHSFELLKNRRQRVHRPCPDRIAVRRFVELCRFLHANQDKFRVCGFSDIDVTALSEAPACGPNSLPLYRTAWRMAQQAYRRLT